jgi:hypothetical protein
MTRDDYTTLTANLRTDMAARLGIRGRDFRRTVRRAEHLLPAGARDAAATLLEVEQRLDHPKLAQRTDPAVARSAAATLQSYLRQRPKGQRAAQRRAWLAAEIGFRAMVLLIAILAVLRWRGYI